MYLVQDPGPWSTEKCVAAVRLLAAVSADPVEMHEATQVRLPCWALADVQTAVYTVV